MKVTHSTIFAAASMCLPALFLVACGGGGSSGSSSSSSNASSANNAFAAKQGTYRNDCSDSPTSSGSESYTLQIGTLKGSASADFSFNAKTYTSTGCVEANKTADVTLTGTLTASAATKVITAQAAADSEFKGGVNKSGTANIADVGISVKTLSKWSGDFPINVNIARVGYLTEGNKLYLLVNPAGQTDGIGGYFSKIQLTKK